MLPLLHLYDSDCLNLILRLNHSSEFLMPSLHSQCGWLWVRMLNIFNANSALLLPWRNLNKVWKWGEKKHFLDEWMQLFFFGQTLISGNQCIIIDFHGRYGKWHQLRAYMQWWYLHFLKLWTRSIKLSYGTDLLHWEFLRLYLWSAWNLLVFRLLTALWGIIFLVLRDFLISNAEQELFEMQCELLHLCPYCTF